MIPLVEDVLRDFGELRMAYGLLYGRSIGSTRSPYSFEGSEWSRRRPELSSTEGSPRPIERAGGASPRSARLPAAGDAGGIGGHTRGPVAAVSPRLDARTRLECLRMRGGIPGQIERQLQPATTSPRLSTLRRDRAPQPGVPDAARRPCRRAPAARRRMPE